MLYFFQNYYAILTSTPNLIYFFPLPITLLVWRRIDVDAIVILKSSSRFSIKNWLGNWKFGAENFCRTDDGGIEIENSSPIFDGTTSKMNFNRWWKNIYNQSDFIANLKFFIPTKSNLFAISKSYFWFKKNPWIFLLKKFFLMGIKSNNSFFNRQKFILCKIRMSLILHWPKYF